jgi:hypothetical protein
MRFAKPSCWFRPRLDAATPATAYVSTRNGEVVPDGSGCEAVQSELDNSLAAVADLEARGRYKDETAVDTSAKW